MDNTAVKGNRNRRTKEERKKREKKTPQDDFANPPKKM